eukprot:scaffold119976_cov72-Phaeocystis_antarctica.AAC.3
MGSAPAARRAERSNTRGSRLDQPWTPNLQPPTCVGTGAPGPEALRRKWHGRAAPAMFDKAAVSAEAVAEMVGGVAVTATAVSAAVAMVL